MCAAESAAENFYENAQAANVNHDNVFTDRSPARGESYPYLNRIISHVAIVNRA